MLLLLILMFTVMPVLELYLLIQVGQVIGTLETITVVIVTGVVGAIFAKAQGRRFLAEIQLKTQSGQVPAEALVSGLLVFIGGILLITPGFVTDIFGLMLVFPITRIIFVKVAKSYFAHQIRRGTVHFHTTHTNWGSQSSWRNVTPDHLDRSNERGDDVIDVTPTDDKP